MKTSLKTLIVVLLTVASFAAAQAFECDLARVIPLSGKICGVDPYTDPTVIKIDPALGCGDQSDTIVEIIGFPFHNLEVQLDDELDSLDPDEDGITIDVGDCVKVEYYVKDNGVNKWCSLLMYCEDCEYCASCITPDRDEEYCLECTGTEDLCFEDDMERDPQPNKKKLHSHPGGK